MKLERDLATEPIIGFRIFRLHEPTTRLTSVAYNTETWLPGEQKQSKCTISGVHVIHEPHEKCTCGIHAAKSRKRLSLVYPGLAYRLTMEPKDPLVRFFTFPQNPPTEFVSAQIRLWGTVIEHYNGYRAQWGEIIPETLQWWPRRAYKHNNKRLQHLREVYGKGG